MTAPSTPYSTACGLAWAGLGLGEAGALPFPIPTLVQPFDVEPIAGTHAMAYCEVEAMDSVLSRREMLALLGMSSAALLDAHAVEAAMAASAESVPTCVVRPAQTEGPYFVDERLNRSDIRTDPASGTARPGAALEVLFRVGRMSRNACAPLVGATVDVWHCDALGAYSDVRDPGGSTEGQKFLRGYQVTDVAGSAVFTTIYPGWYPGRAVHIHFKIRTAPGTSPVYEFTSQIYFDDAITDRVHALPPYALHGSRRLRNERDGLFGSSGRQLTVAPAEKSRGYAVAFDVGLQIA